MKSVAVIGATSQISKFILPRLAEKGHQVLPIARSASTAHGFATYASTPGTDGRRLPPSPVDTLISTAPITITDDLCRLVDTLRPGHVIVVSSMSRISKENAPNAADRAFAAELARCEDIVQNKAAAAGAAWTILRPTMIYGAGQDRNVSFIADVIKRVGFFPIVAGARGLRQPVHAEDLAAACVAAITQPGALNRAFEIGGGSVLTYAEFVRSIFHSLDRSPRLLPLPLGVFQAAVMLGRIVPSLAFVTPGMVARMSDDLIADNTDLAAILDIHPRPFAPDGSN